mmetsp:Transcript_9130/g.33687  ORF Transcript_9130/g.33687 Transcript_9130/m.33687 type:complete len:434 (-) Transcript_9130:829-2130(-)
MSSYRPPLKKPRLSPRLHPLTSLTTPESQSLSKKLTSFNQSLTENITKYQNLTLQALQIQEKYQVSDVEIYVSADVMRNGSDADQVLKSTLPSDEQQSTHQLRIQIQGNITQSSARLLNNQSDASEGHDHARKCILFTSLFNHLLVTFPKEIFGKSIKPLEWRRTSGFVDCDGFTLLLNDVDLSMLSRDQFRVNIQLGMGKQNVTLYRTTKKLTALLYGEDYVRNAEQKHGEWRTQYQIMQQVWLYIQTQQLQHRSDSKLIECDDKLRRLVHSDTILVNELHHRLKEHLIPSDAVHLKYTVHPLSASNNNHEQLFARKIPLQQKDTDQYDTVCDPQLDHQIDALDKEIDELHKMIHHHKKRRDFMDQFCIDPINHIYDVICEQTFHLQMMNNELEEASRYSSFWKKPWVDQAVERALRIDEGQLNLRDTHEEE